MLTTPAQNPFALLMNPDSVLQAIERSERLSRLQSRICRPLDKPQPARPGREEPAAGPADADRADGTGS
jgi:hypothetical protein